MDQAFVIVGGGLAGAKAAETLRAEGFGGRVTLIGAEQERPYERPPLSKGLLLGTASRDEPYVHTPGFYAEHNIELRTGVAVTSVDRSAHVVRTDGGDEIPYTKLLLATGATPRRLPGTLSLRTFEDSDRIAAAVTEGTRLVVLGAGWIGLEVAAAARERGADVTVVTRGTLPLQRVLGVQMATIFANLHRDHGVSFVDQLPGDFEADVTLAAIGVTPNDQLAIDAGLEVEDGILVSSSFRTSDPDIFAAGDVAAIDHPLLGARVRVEHWANALNGGPYAARAMLGQDVRWDHLPYFFTDQYDLGMEYAGWVPPDVSPDLVVRGDVAAREFIAFWTTEGRVLAGMNVNVWDVTDRIQELIRAGEPVDLARLADPSAPL